MDTSPSEEVVTTQASYTDILKVRISNIDDQLKSLDSDFRKGIVSSDEFVERQMSLKRTREVLSDELSRLGVVH